MTITPLGSANEIEDIIVTSQKREQSSLEVPNSFDTYEHTQLETMGLQGTADFIEVMPGVSGSNNFSPAVGTLNVRGLSTRVTGDPLVSVYLDEVAYGIATYAITPNSCHYKLLPVLTRPPGGCVAVPTRHEKLSFK